MSVEGLLGRRIVLVLALAGFAMAAGADLTYEGTQVGAIVGGVPDYAWWYGCSPTSAGMMLGHYDRAYPDETHGLGNIVPGSLAEASTYPTDSYHNGTSDMIASPGHIADFYAGGYGASGDDVAGTLHAFNSLADFMGTSQDSVGNSNGGTAFYNYTDGSAMHYGDIPGLGLTDQSGMYGIYEYLDYSGYGSRVVNLYNQYTDNQGLTDGFTLDDFRTEIDAGRTVLVHVEGHTMLGLAYGPERTIGVYDTWTEGVHSMTWGGSYSGLDQFGVTVLELIVPEPATMLLLALGVTGMAVRSLRRRN